VLKLDTGQKVWFWDIIDSDTRYLLASHISLTRTTKDAQKLLELASKRAGRIPKVVITDRLAAYLDGVELAFGADTRHVATKPFTVEENTNLIERFHGSLKDRTKVMRGMKNIRTARLLTEGWLIHYNYLRPHETLGKTPAEAAGIKFPYRHWQDVVVGRKTITPKQTTATSTVQIATLESNPRYTKSGLRIKDKRHKRPRRKRAEIRSKLPSQVSMVRL